jgi:hypothetical protein
MRRENVDRRISAGRGGDDATCRDRRIRMVVGRAVWGGGSAITARTRVAVVTFRERPTPADMPHVSSFSICLSGERSSRASASRRGGAYHEPPPGF